MIHTLQFENLKLATITANTTQSIFWEEQGLHY